MTFGGQLGVKNIHRNTSFTRLPLKMHYSLSFCSNFILKPFKVRGDMVKFIRKHWPCSVSFALSLHSSTDTDIAKMQLCYWLFLVSFALYAKVGLSYQYQSFGIRNHGLLTSGKGFFPTYHKSHHLFLPIA